MRFNDFREPADWIARILFSPVLWGGILTVGFYTLLPRLPGESAFWQRYFCSHWVLYATTALFFVGASLLARKSLSLAVERSAARLDLFPAGLPTTADVDALLLRCRERLLTVPAALRRTQAVQRFVDICEWLAARRHGRGIEEHLKYLADMAADRLHGSLAPVRTITWAIPILGFLGTVLGITVAISGIDPARLETSLPGVTAGLGVAFDTTALSLALSIVLVFCAFLVERMEQGILNDVEKSTLRTWSALATAEPAAAGSPAERIEAAWAEEIGRLARRTGEALTEKTTALVSGQLQIWQEAVEQTRRRWLENADSQQQQFAALLQQGMTTTLHDHAAQLQAMRQEFLEQIATHSSRFTAACRENQERLASAVEQVAARLAGIAASLETTARQNQTQFSEQAARLWDGVTQEVRRLQETLREETAAWISAAATQSAELRQPMIETVDALRRQSAQLQEQGALLLKIVEQEESLVRLQERLDENLSVLRTSEAFAETLQSLTAAVHVLTIRQRAA